MFQSGDDIWVMTTQAMSMTRYRSPSVSRNAIRISSDASRIWFTAPRSMLRPFSSFLRLMLSVATGDDGGVVTWPTEGDCDLVEGRMADEELPFVFDLLVSRNEPDERAGLGVL